MYGFAFLLLLLIGVGLVAWYGGLFRSDGEGEDARGCLYGREKEPKEMKSEKENSGPPQTKEFVGQLLAELGCNILNETEGGFTFNFQGGTFILTAHDDSPQVFISYPHFYSVAGDDLDAFIAMQRVVNEANKHFGTSIVYESDTEDNEIALYGWREVFLFREIDGAAQFLRAMLSGIFRAALYVEGEMEKYSSGHRAED